MSSGGKADVLDGSGIASAPLAGRYHVIDELGRGAMGVVYRALDERGRRTVALKRMRPDRAMDPGLVERFRMEARVLSAARHPNLVEVLDAGDAGGTPYYAMELVDGESVLDAITDADSVCSWLSRWHIASVVSQIAGALDALHAVGLLHRDVKPNNILLADRETRAILIDAGLARTTGSDGEASGTPGYIAPESFTGRVESIASDVYGLAATAYAMMTSSAPFGHSIDAKVVLRRQLDTLPPAPSSIRPSVPSSVDRLIMRGLSVVPGQRPSSAGAFGAELADALAGSLEDAAIEWAPDRCCPGSWTTSLCNCSTAMMM